MARVLVVEDDQDVRGLIRHRLNKTEHTVEEALTGEGALRLLSEQEYDVVTLDINLPGISGYEVARKIASDPKLCHIPVVVLSVLERDEAPQDVVIKEWLTKPFKSQQLKQSIEQALTPANEESQKEAEGS